MTPDPQNSIGKIKSKSHWRDIAVASTHVSNEDLPVLMQGDRGAKFVWIPVAFGTLAIVVLFVLFFLLPPSRLEKPSKELVSKVQNEGDFAPIAGIADEEEKSNSVVASDNNGAPITDGPRGTGDNAPQPNAESTASEIAVPKVDSPADSSTLDIDSAMAALSAIAVPQNLSSPIDDGVPTPQKWLRDPERNKQSDAQFLIEFLKIYPTDFIKVNQEIDLKLELKNIRDKLTEHFAEPK